SFKRWSICRKVHDSTSARSLERRCDPPVELRGGLNDAVLHPPGGASPVEEGGRVHRAGGVGARRVEQTGRGIAIEPRELVLVAETAAAGRSEEHTSELQSRFDLVCRLLLEKKNSNRGQIIPMDRGRNRDTTHKDNQ